MKKKIIISNIVTIFISLCVLFIVFLLAVSHINYENTKSELNNYLNIATAIYTGDNEQEVINAFSTNKDIRITIIDLEGNVVTDSTNETQNENHLERPEIINPGTIYFRYSESLNIKMMYIASITNNHYLRVAIPERSINSFITNFLPYEIISLALLLIISILFTSYITKKIFLELRLQVNKLSEIVNKDDNLIEDDVDFLANKIEDVRFLIDEKMKIIDSEKNKLMFILNNINSGIVVINSLLNVEIINKEAIKVLELEKTDIINKNYLYLFRSIELQNLVSEASKNKSVFEYQEEINGNYYLIRVNSIENLWDSSNLFGVVINYINITELKRLEKTKKEFFANASHELKSPLTSIIGYQQMIKEGIITNKEEIEDATTRTINEANRMNKIIIEMLTLSKLESNFVNKMEQIDLKKQIEDIIENYDQEIKQEKLIVNSDLKAKIICANRIDIEMLIKNLFENAIKYNKKDGQIDIFLTDKYLSITDTGIGISKENQKHIFERFYRVDKGYSKSKNGTGLGLAIVKHVCLNYGFIIKVESELGKGTCIKIYFKKEDL